MDLAPSETFEAPPAYNIMESSSAEKR